MKTKKIAALAIAAAVTLGAGAYGTRAWFTSSATSGANQIQAGTLKVNVNGADEVQSFVIPLKNTLAEPGDVLTNPNGDGYYSITIKNNGSLNMATFGRFTLDTTGGNEQLAKDIMIQDYKVTFNRSTPRADDNFIVNGVKSNEQFATNLYGWVNGNGPLDIPGTPWDIEGLKPGESFTITFRLVYNTDATVQGKTINMGYEVNATQVNKGAIEDLPLDIAVTPAARDNAYTYMNDQVNGKY